MRLTQFGHGGGCACKIPPGELEAILSGLLPDHDDHEHRLLVGLETGDDAAAVRLDGDRAILATTDFFSPVVDDPYDWGRIAATNALSDIYAMGGEPLVALNILGWPREVLPMSLAAEVLRGGIEVTRAAGCHLAGGHSIDDPEPKYGLAVTGMARPDELMRLDAGTPGLPLTLTKPIGSGVLNNRHKVTGDRFDQAIEVMTTLNRDASRAALRAGIRCATDVTGFGLLGHLYKVVRASGVTARIDASAVPLIDDALDSAKQGYVSGGTRRNLDWVAPYVEWTPDVSDETRVLLADAQTSGGLLLAGELPGFPVIGELVPRGDAAIVVS